jgi:hypothetical protein
MVVRTPAAHYDVIDVLERVLSKGVVFEAGEGVLRVTGGPTLSWYRVAIAGIDVLSAGPSVSWQYLIEAAETQNEEE